MAFIGITGKSNAASYTWDGGGSTNNWSECANWSTNICPTAADNVTFSSTSTKDATIDAGWTGGVVGFTIAATYSGTITMERSLTTTGTFSQASGTFTASNQMLDMNGAFTLSGGNFTASSGTTSVASAMTISAGAVFTHNSGTFSFDGNTSAALACSNKTFNLVAFAHTGTRVKTIGADCSFGVGANPVLGGDLNADITLNGTLSGTGTLQVGTAAGGNLLTLNSTGVLSGFSGLNTGAVTATNFTEDFSAYSPFNLSGAYIQSGGTITVPNSADFNGAFTLDAGGVFNAPSGTLHLASAFTLNPGTTFNHNDGILNFDGTATAAITCNGAEFNLVTFTAGTLAKTINTGCTMPLGNNPTINSRLSLGGTLTGSGLVTDNQIITFISGSDLAGFTGWVSNNTFSIGGGTVDFSGYTTVDINGFLAFTTGTLTAPEGDMTLSSNFLDSAFSGTFNHNNGTVAFDATGAQYINSSVTFNNLTATTPSSMNFAENHTTTVLGTLTLQGSDNRYLALNSRTPGTQWQIDPQGTRSIAYVNVSDSNNVNTTAITGSHFEDGGNNINWEFDKLWKDISYRSDLRKTIISDGLRHMDPRLIKLADGRLAMVYSTNAGTVPGSQVVYSSDLGATWTSQVELFADYKPLAMNVLKDGTVLAFDCTLDVDGNMETYVQRSTDNMQTWGARTLVRFDIPGNPAVEYFSSPAGPAVELTNGDLLLPLTHRYDRGTGWVISHDKGVTWEYGGTWTPIPDAGAEFNEPWVDYLDDGSLMVIIRSNTGNDRWIARSYDEGQTWTAPELAFGGGSGGGGLPSWIQLDSGVVVVFNRGSGQKWSYRVSRDRGETWNEQVYFDTNRMQYANHLEVAPGMMALAYAVSTSGSESGPQNIYFNYFVDRSDATITTDSLPNGTIGSSYAQTLETTGTQGPTNFTISAGSLPAGLSLNSSTGAITGTPSSPGSFQFTVAVTDNGMFNTALGEITTQAGGDSHSYTLTVSSPPPSSEGGSTNNSGAIFSQIGTAAESLSGGLGHAGAPNTGLAEASGTWLQDEDSGSLTIDGDAPWVRWSWLLVLLAAVSGSFIFFLRKKRRDQDPQLN